jgi:hypothetical protein
MMLGDFITLFILIVHLKNISKIQIVQEQEKQSGCPIFLLINIIAT